MNATSLNASMASLSSLERISALKLRIISQMSKTILKAEAGATFQPNETLDVVGICNEI